MFAAERQRRSVSAGRWADHGVAVGAGAAGGQANALVRWGTQQQQQRWLPLWLGEQPVQAAIAVQEQHPLFSADKLRCSATSQRKGFTLNGEKTLVPLGGKAQLYLVAAHYHGKPRLFIVPADTAGLSVAAQPALGLPAAATGTLTLDNGKLGHNALLGGEHSDFRYRDFLDPGPLH